jgi:hypothetical protein
MKPTVAIALSAVLASGLLHADTAAAQSRQVQPSRPSTQPSQPAAQAQAGVVDPNSVAGWASQVLAMVDSGQLAQLWDGASAVTKKSTKRDDFIAAVQAARESSGAVSGREWLAVRRQHHPGGDDVPGGEYASVELVALFANKQVKSELVTLRRDEDGTWRFAGYVVR